jgi:hypothetical protein
LDGVAANNAKDGTVPVELVLWRRQFPGYRRYRQWSSRKGIATAAGVSATATSPNLAGSSCLPTAPATVRGCRAVPRLPRNFLPPADAQAIGRPTQLLMLGGNSVSDGDGGTIAPQSSPGPGRPTTGTGQCFERHSLDDLHGEFADALNCLTSPDCRAIGAVLPPAR